MILFAAVITLIYLIRDYRRVSQGRDYTITYPRFGIQSRKDHLRLLILGIAGGVFLIAIQIIQYGRLFFGWRI
jgi:hypothetical protein